MAMHAVEKERTPRLSLGEQRNMVTHLLVVNLAVFILVKFTEIIYKMEGMQDAAFTTGILQNIRVSADLQTFITHPWTLVSALFVHSQVIDVFSNMIWLWGFGTFLQQQAGHRRILPVYLFGGFTGIAFYLAAMNLIPAFTVLAPSAYVSGAQASIMALAIAATVVAPRYRVLPLLMGGIPFWIITFVYIAVNIGANVSGMASFANYPFLLGGAIFGWLYAGRLKKGQDIGEGFNKAVFGISHMFHPSEQKVYKEEQIPDNIFNKKENTPFRKIGVVPEHRLNEILDKIHTHGMAALSPEEQEILLRASRDEDAPLR